MSELRVDTITTTDNQFSVEVANITKDGLGSVTDLQAVPTPSSRVYRVSSLSGTGDLGQGTFAFVDQDLSSEVSSDPLAGVYVPPQSDLAGANGAWVRQGAFDNGVKPEWFGAQADGVADDTSAIQAAFSLHTHVLLSPDSTYLITDSIDVPDGGILEGANPRAAVGVRWDSDLNDFFRPANITAIAVDFGAGQEGMDTSAIKLNQQGTVKGISFYYPSQGMFTENNTPETYAATIGLNTDANGVDGLTSIESPTAVDCHFCNPWQAINFSSRHALGRVEACTGYAWDNFIFIDESYDVDRILECQINTTLAYIGNYGPDNMYGYQGSLPNSACIRLGKADACRMSGTFGYGFYKGIHVDKFGTGYPNGTFIYGGGFEGCVTPLYAVKFQGLYVYGTQLGSDTIGTDSGAPYSTMPEAQQAVVASGASGDVARKLILDGVVVWISRWSAVDANYVDGLFLNNCSFANGNRVDRGFQTGVIQAHLCTNTSINNCFVEQNSGNANGQYLNVTDSQGIIYSGNTHRGSSYLDGWYLGNVRGGFVGKLIEENNQGGSRIITTAAGSSNITVGDVIQW